MLKKKNAIEFEEKGITLIALVITIIVLLILAGVTINLTLGQNGIFKTAEGAAKNYTEAQNKELAELSNFEASIVAGKVAREENGIQYVGDGRGNLIPVPKGFSYLEGTKDNGFVIKNDTDGNEFVWVPVEGMSYTYARYDFEKQYGSYSDYLETMPSDEQTSVATYGGYYIGRYEAGIEGGTLSSKSNSSITDEEQKKNWTGYTGGKLVVQKDAQVWNYITRDKAVEVATGLYNKTEDNVTSKLCSSYAWDTALRFIETQNSGYATDSTQGNYLDKADTLGKPADTGKTEAVNNIYDMGGNVWEWTTESCSNASSPCTIRGGNCANSSSDDPASDRHHYSETYANVGIGLRATLFM